MLSQDKISYAKTWLSERQISYAFSVTVTEKVNVIENNGFDTYATKIEIVDKRL